MVELAQDRDFVHDIVQVVLQFGFVEHFNGDLHVRVVFIVRHKHLAKGTHSQDLGVFIDVVVVFQFIDSLLLGAVACSQRVVVFLGLNGAFKLTLCAWLDTAHYSVAIFCLIIFCYE